MQSFCCCIKKQHYKMTTRSETDINLKGDEDDQHQDRHADDDASSLHKSQQQNFSDGVGNGPLEELRKKDQEYDKTKSFDKSQQQPRSSDKSKQEDSSDSLQEPHKEEQKDYQPRSSDKSKQEEDSSDSLRNNSLEEPHKEEQKDYQAGSSDKSKQEDSRDSLENGSVDELNKEEQEDDQARSSDKSEQDCSDNHRSGSCEELDKERQVGFQDRTASLCNEQQQGENNNQVCSSCRLTTEPQVHESRKDSNSNKEEPHKEERELQRANSQVHLSHELQNNNSNHTSNTPQTRGDKIQDSSLFKPQEEKKEVPITGSSNKPLEKKKIGGEQEEQMRDDAGYSYTSKFEIFSSATVELFPVLRQPEIEKQLNEIIKINGTEPKRDGKGALIKITGQYGPLMKTVEEIAKAVDRPSGPLTETVKNNRKPVVQEDVQSVEIDIEKEHDKEFKEKVPEKKERRLRKDLTDKDFKEKVPEKKERHLLKDLTPESKKELVDSQKAESIKELDNSQTQKLQADENVLYNLHKHTSDIKEICHTTECCIKVVAEYTGEKSDNSFQVTPFVGEENLNETAKKRVDEATELFCNLCRKITEPSSDNNEETFALPPNVFQELKQWKTLTDILQRRQFAHDLGFQLTGSRDVIKQIKQEFWDTLSKVYDDKARNIRFQFHTVSGILVSILQGNLVHQTIDAIVNPANIRLSHGGGAARCIANAAGEELEKECRDYIRHMGNLKTTGVMHTTAGKLKPNIRFVIHAVGPENSERKKAQKLFDDVKTVVYNCLLHAHHMEMRSIAIPAISSGIYGVPIKIVAEASYMAVMEFDRFYQSSERKSLGKICFINIDEETVHAMKTSFESLQMKNIESGVDPEKHSDTKIYVDMIDEYAKASGLSRIAISPSAYCFEEAISVVLQNDHSIKLDVKKIRESIIREINTRTNHYENFKIEGLSKQLSNKGKQSWLESFISLFDSESKDGKYEMSVYIDAAANALKMKIILVEINDEGSAYEVDLKPSSYEDCKVVYIAHNYANSHHHFDALIKKNNLEESRSGGPKETLESSSEKGRKVQSNSSANHNLSMDSMGYSKQSSSNEPKTSGDDFENIQKSEADDMDNCIICMEDHIIDPKQLPCKHKFCTQCIDDYFAKCQPKCPSCGQVYGMLRGNQPKGTMTWSTSRQSLAGHGGCGTIQIQYSFPNGVQREDDPNPGQPYVGTHRTAFLPDNKEGNDILQLLRQAFDAKLVFTIGRSNTTGRDNVVVWNDVHHKTSFTGQYGYPDETYLKRVREELAAKGIK